MKFEALKPIDLREAWTNEATDFTPWLASQEGLEMLGQAINMELELDETEKGVGPYRADIVCVDTSTNMKVLIENQIEKTNHNHLGQILTYAAGLNAVTIIWIAKSFTDEHRATLDWMNEISNEEINFFGCEIELWQIGNSGFAPKLNIVSKPNDWLKQRSTSYSSKDMSDTRMLQLDFWTKFNECLKESGSFIKGTKARPQGWNVYSIGRSKFWLSTTVNTQSNRISVSVNGRGPFASGFYSQLEDQKNEIEEEIGSQLIWKMASKQFVIRKRNADTDPTKKESWPAYFSWLKENVEKFHTVFSKRIKRLKEIELKDDELEADDD